MSELLDYIKKEYQAATDNNERRGIAQKYYDTYINEKFPNFKHWLCFIYNIEEDGSSTRGLMTNSIGPLEDIGAHQALLDKLKEEDSWEAFPGDELIYPLGKYLMVIEDSENSLWFYGNNVSRLAAMGVVEFWLEYLTRKTRSKGIMSEFVEN